MRELWGISLGAITMLTSTSVASASEKDDRTIYQATYFESFSPVTALDLVQRVPGFSLDAGAQDIRGFAQAAGNILINGSRPATKSDTLDMILTRIPASRVSRVEIGPGDQFGSEYAGKTAVLNIILTDANGLSGTITGTTRRSYDGSISPQASASALVRLGDSTFSIAAGYDNRRFSEEGGDIVTRLSDGAILETRDKLNEMHDRQPYISGSWSLENGPRRSAHMNFRVARHRFDLLQTSRSHLQSGQIRDDELIQDYERSEFELGADLTRPLLGGSIKFLGLTTRRQREDIDISRLALKTDASNGYLQDLDYRHDERLGSVNWSGATQDGWNIEIGAEGTFNRLISKVELFRIGTDQARTPVELPIADATVKEYRGEAFASLGHAITSDLRVDLGTTYEFSHLIVEGDAEAERALRFLKPRASLDWRPTGHWHFQFTLARTVGQLNFEDFVSAAELASERVSGGNAALVPQRAVELLATAERRLLGDGMARLEFGYNSIGQLQDRVPTPDGLDAPGNLGTGRSAFVKGNLDLPLGELGIKGGRLSVEGLLQDTSVKDPYTNLSRRFSGFSDWALDAGFRQDLGPFAWGFKFTAVPSITYYWREEIDRSGGTSAFVTGFAEYRFSPQTILTFGLDNIFDGRGTRDRIFYDGDRGEGTPTFTENRQRNRHVQVYFTLKQSFQ